MASESHEIDAVPEAAARARARIEAIHHELADEHRRIMALVEQLEGDGADLPRVPLLAELHALLVNHFAREQFPGGLYDALGRLGSAHHEELRALVREHCEILSSVRAVLERSRWAPDTEAAGLLAQASAVIASVRAHEQREHALARRVLAP